MGYHWLYIVALALGGIISVIGVAYVVLNIAVVRANRVKSFFEGIGYFLFGTLMIWLGAQGLSGERATEIDLGISESQFAVFLLILGVGAFVLKSVLNIREGRERLRDKTLSPFLVFKSRFQIVSAIIFLAFLAFVLINFLSQLSK